MSTDRFFLDTSYALALLNAQDQHHSQAQNLFGQVRNAREVWVTEAVLTEVGNALARSNRLKAIEFIERCYKTSNIRVVSVNADLFHRAMDFYRSRPDKEWGLTDCISFVVMQDHDLVGALAADEHFRQAGFQTLLQ